MVSYSAQFISKCLTQKRPLDHQATEDEDITHNDIRNGGQIISIGSAVPKTSHTSLNCSEQDLCPIKSWAWTWNPGVYLRLKRSLFFFSQVGQFQTSECLHFYMSHRRKLTDRQTTHLSFAQGHHGIIRFCSQKQGAHSVVLQGAPALWWLMQKLHPPNNQILFKVKPGS